MARRLPQIGLAVLIIYWVAIFIATHVPKVPSTRFTYADKVAHFVAYAGLAWLVAMALRLKHVPMRIVVPLVLLTAATYGAIDEFLQNFTHREASVYDWIADVLGATTGLIVFSLTYPVLRWWYYRGRPIGENAVTEGRESTHANRGHS